jgi:hypothetical protein
MNLIHRILPASLRTLPAAGRPRSHKPKLESLEDRALLSASPATVTCNAPSAAVSSRSPAIVAGTDLSQGTIIPVLSLNSIHGGHAHGGTVHVRDVRHAVA